MEHPRQKKKTVGANVWRYEGHEEVKWQTVKGLLRFRTISLLTREETGPAGDAEGETREAAQVNGDAEM